MPVDPMIYPGRRITEARKLRRARVLYWLRRASVTQRDATILPFPKKDDA